MLEAFEQFCKDHEKTIAFVEAFSTLAAVLVSLMLAFSARRANKTRLKAWVDVRRIVHSTIPPETRLRYITAIIMNIGMQPLRIPFAFFHWQLPLQKNASWMVNPLNAYATDEWVQQEQYPIEIAPKASCTLIVSNIATFQQEFRAMVRERPGLLARIFFRFVRVTILTDDGMRFRAKVSAEVRKEMAQLNALY
jgi:hypothetical protein